LLRAVDDAPLVFDRAQSRKSRKHPMPNSDNTLVCSENSGKVLPFGGAADRLEKAAEESRQNRPVAVSPFRAGGVRDAFSGPGDMLPAGLISDAGLWEALRPVTPCPVSMRANGLFPDQEHPASSPQIDSLRTRLWQLCQKNGWRRVLVTSPRAGSGKSLVAANLALSFARRPSGKTVLVDLALGAPALGKLFGVAEVGDLAGYLAGLTPLEQHFHRLGTGLALGLTGMGPARAGDHLLEPLALRKIAEITDRLAPDLTLFDAPPVLGGDGALALLPQVEAALLVVDGTRDTAQSIAESIALIEDSCPLAGIVLNRADAVGYAP
jgi:protein-tyrosine kinase